MQGPLAVYEINVSAVYALQLPTSALRHYDTCPFDEVGETGEATPYYCRPWRRVGSAVEITPEACVSIGIETGPPIGVQ